MMRYDQMAGSCWLQLLRICGRTASLTSEILKTKVVTPSQWAGRLPSWMWNRECISLRTTPVRAISMMMMLVWLSSRISGELMTDAVNIGINNLAWMAAIIDMKGRITRKNNKMRRTPQVVLQVDTKELRVARRLCALTDVAPGEHEVTSTSFARRGCIEHCLEPHIHVDIEHPWQMPAITRWALTGATAAVILLNIKPYMVTYGDYQADVDLIIENLVTRGQGTGMVRASLDRLRQLGWVIPQEVEAKMATGIAI